MSSDFGRVVLIYIFKEAWLLATIDCSYHSLIVLSLTKLCETLRGTYVPSRLNNPNTFKFIGDI
jgi:hypothetical protein